MGEGGVIKGMERSWWTWKVFVFCGGMVLFFGSTERVFAVPRATTDGTRPEAIKPLLQGRKIGLAIGINHYRDPHWYPLKYAARDARRFRKMMLYGGFQKRRTLLLTSPQQTTLSSIKQALLRLKSFNTSPMDTVVIYISAHGTVVSNTGKGQRYIITSDTHDEKIVDSALSVRWLRQILRSFPSRRKALILATCYSGKPHSKSRLPRGQKGVVLASPVPYSTTMLILNAASFRYSAYESQELRSDVYTHFLLGCIRQLARKGKGYVTATQAHSCSVRKTYQYVLKHRKVRQLPGLEADVTGLEAVYLFGKVSPAPSSRLSSSRLSTLSSSRFQAKGGLPLVQIPQSLLDRYRVHFQRLSATSRAQDMAQYFDTPGEWLTTFPPGRYQVTFLSRKKDKPRVALLQLRRGQRVMLRDPAPASRHTLALSAGFARSGTPLLDASYLSLALTYRYWIGALALSWEGLGQPAGTKFSLQRLALRLELGWPFLLLPRLSLFPGLFARPGATLRQSNSQQWTATFSLQTGATLSLAWFFSSSWGLSFGADLGLDYTPSTQHQNGLSLYWRLATSLLFSF